MVTAGWKVPFLVILLFLSFKATDATIETSGISNFYNDAYFIFKLAMLLF